MMNDTSFNKTDKRNNIYPFCQCKSINKEKYYFSSPKITTCDDGMTCDACGHYVIWTNLNEIKKDNHRESRDNKLINHEKQLINFLKQEYILRV